MDTRWRSSVDHLDGELVGQRFGELTVTTVTADPHETIRTPAMITDTAEHDFFVSVLTRGSGEIFQDQRKAELSDGAFTLVDGARPFMFRFDAPFQQPIVRIPRLTLTTRLPDQISRHVTASAVSAHAGAGRLVSGVLQQLATLDAPVCGPHQHTALAVRARHARYSAVQSSRRHFYHWPRPRGRSPTRTTTPTRTAARPGLTLSDVSNALGLSPRDLSQIFREHGSTPQAWLFHARTERARRLLLGTDTTVSEISDRVGFKDVAHFSRSFSRRFGASPGRYRTEASRDRTEAVKA